MRPDRGIVVQAIRDAGGNLSKAAISLGCSRQTLYTWVYQFGLEKLAGIRLDTRDALDRRERVDAERGKTIKTGVYSRESGPGNLRAVTPQAATEQHVPATVKLPESLWKRVRTKAIWDGCTVGEIVRRALERDLEDGAAAPAEKKGRR